MRRLVRRLNNEKGQGIIEYSLIIGLIASVLIAVMVAIGPKITNTYNNALSGLTTSRYNHTDNGNHNGHGHG